MDHYVKEKSYPPTKASFSIGSSHHFSPQIPFAIASYSHSLLIAEWMDAMPIAVDETMVSQLDNLTISDTSHMSLWATYLLITIFAYDSINRSTMEF
jgi:hypothetical protein